MAPCAFAALVPFPLTHAIVPTHTTLRVHTRTAHACAISQRHAPPPRRRARRRHFLNLTNGLEAAASVAHLVALEQVRVTRVQSSHCEAGAYDALLCSLGPELLFSLATGYRCYVYDFGSRDTARGVPRAIFLGLEFVRWALTRLWFDRTPERVLVRGKNVAPFWRDDVMQYQIHKKTKKMIRYYSAFAHAMAVDKVRLTGVYGPFTKLDGRMDDYAALVRDVWSIDDHLPPAGDVDEGADDGDTAFATRLYDCGLCLYDSSSSAEELAQRQAQLQNRRKPEKC